MTRQGERGSTGGGGLSFLRAFAELAGAWAIAFAWPIYQRVDSGPEAMTGIGARQLDIVVFMLVVSLAVPAILAVAEWLVARVSRRAGVITHATLLGLILGALVWQQVDSLPEVLRILIPLGVLAAVTVGYLRTEFLRNFALILSVAAPVVLGLFAASGTVRPALTPEGSALESQTAQNDVPVVIVILDELPLAALMDADRQIDGRYFPRLRELQDGSTWYRSALSVADNTLSAAPAIFTGEDPPVATGENKAPPPGVADFPDTVCSIPERAGYEVFSIELVTDFCRRPDGLPNRVSALIRQGVPPAVPDFLPPELQGGADEYLTPKRLLERAIEAVTGRFPIVENGYGLERLETVDTFVEGMPDESGSLSLFHVALPHVEYQFLPSGRVYGSRVLTDSESADSFNSPVNDAESAKNLQQLTAQMIYTDTVLGRIIDRMKEAGIWEESLFVLTADHGASFRLGTSRRILTEENAGWLLPVPLFVKYPGQERGEIVDADVDSRDITPTVLAALGLEPAPDSTGRDLGTDPLPPRDTVTAISRAGDGPLTMDSRRLRRLESEAVRFRNRHLGSGQLYALGGHSDLVGRQVRPGGRFRELEFSSPSITADTEFDPDGILVPAYFQAELPGLERDPGPLAITVNGRVAATARAWQRDGAWMTGVTLDEDAFESGPPRVRVFAIGG